MLFCVSDIVTVSLSVIGSLDCVTVSDWFSRLVSLSVIGYLDCVAVSDWFISRFCHYQ